MEPVLRAGKRNSLPYPSVQTAEVRQCVLRQVGSRSQVSDLESGDGMEQVGMVHGQKPRSLTGERRKERKGSVSEGSSWKMTKKTNAPCFF